tara:strand:+ start:147 stop:443 length:297 start_codon:yes stop_codon:yes gene_type:complete
LGSDTADLVSTLGFPVVCAAAAGIFGYKVVFYILRDLSGDIKGVHKIIIKLIDRLNINDRETNKLSKEIAQLRCEVASLYKCLGVSSRKPTGKQKAED